MAEDDDSGVPKDVDQVKYAALVWLIFAAIIAILLYLSYSFGRKGKKKSEKTRVGPSEPIPRQVGGARRPRRMRVRRDVSESDEDFNRFDDTSDIEDDKGEGKVGTKKLRKLEMKAEKKAAREAEQEEREERKRREMMLTAERKKDDERRQQEEKEKEERERLRKEEEERKEYEEYLQIKASFVVEESGEVGIITEEESQSLLQEFIDHIKNSKVVLLEDLGARFSLKTQEAIDRLEHLLESGRITGVMDDRGKFIYISEEELENVAKFIKQRGRISIAELAESSNALINMHGEKSEKANLISVAS